MGLLQLAVTWYMLECKLPTGTSKTKKIQIYLDEVALFWMFQWAACPPACTMWPLAAKGPFLARSYEALNVGKFTWKYIFKSGSMSRLPKSSQNQFCGRGPVAISLSKTTFQNHSRQIQKKVSSLPLRCFPQVLVNNEVPMYFYIKRFPLQRLHDFFRRAIEFVIWGTDFKARDDWQVYSLSSGVKPSFLKCDFRFSSALESSAYLKLT